MTVLDASVWISSLLTDEAESAVSRRWLAGWVDAGGILVAPILLVAEVAGAVARRRLLAEAGRRAATELLIFPSLRLEPLDRTSIAAVADLAATGGLRGADATYVSLAAELGLPLVTWDREQAARAGSVTVYTPPTAPTVPPR